MHAKLQCKHVPSRCPSSVLSSASSLTLHCYILTATSSILDSWANDPSAEQMLQCFIHSMKGTASLPQPLGRRLIYLLVGSRTYSYSFYATGPVSSPGTDTKGRLRTQADAKLSADDK
ncbi:hypothetical protein EGR_10926 [Echinococcus granulosus]|uniref:Uncharacterized protein n=1 Tax=Echinococcus granulosus TaxID=6210 RepID=W6U160_ECHGR|nr:hypothetical protein EGR_10926 [Echinococcus granulosus]EUB54216.1 hypothetical protein EGR_10926 [Echinococcus granulosus]